MSQTYTAAWSRRLDEVGLTALFGVFFCLSCFMPVKSQTFVVNVFMLGLWGTMATLGLAVLLLTVSEVTLTPTSVTLRSLTRRVTIPLDHLAALECTQAGTSSRALFKCANGRNYTLLFKSYPDPATMRTALETWFAPNEANLIQAAMRSRRVFKKGSVSLALICLSLVLLGISIVTEPLSGAGLTLIGCSLLGVFAGILSRRDYAQVMPEGIVQQFFWVTKRVGWEQADSVTLWIQSSPRGGSRNERMTIASGTTNMYLGEAYDDWEILRDVVLANVPAQKVTDKRYGA